MRNSYKFSLILSTSLLVGSFTDPTHAGNLASLRQGQTSAYGAMQPGPNTRAPFAFIRYCVSNPEACRTGEVRRLDWTSDIRSLVTQMNQSVNRSIRPVNDKGRDNWQANVPEGDCEEFALTKRERLMKAGLPASALRMAVATTRLGEGHAVLVVSTDQGDFILDNRNDRIMVWHQTDLTFQKIASAEDPRLWHRPV